jgi:hypothetical protein
MKTIEQLQILLDVNHTNTKSSDRYDETALSLLVQSGIVGIDQPSIVSEKTCYLTPKGVAVLEIFKTNLTVASK